MVVPMLVVIVLSFFGLHTMICLGAGMVSSLILGLFAGTITLHKWLTVLLLPSFQSAGESVIVMMIWVAAFGGVIGSPCIRRCRAPFSPLL